MFGGVLQPTTQAFTDQVIQRGATGNDVVELQARLQYIGFYNSRIDGVYGWSTYWAVRNYQNEFGLDVDGLVGPKMKEMLERSTNFDKDFVHRALNEGRSFTHYGTTPLHIQKGPKGSNDTKGQKGQPQANPKARQQAQPEDRSSGSPGTGAPEAPDSPAPGTPTPETPEDPQAEEPVPYEEVPEEQGDDPNIEKAMNVPNGFSENDIRIMAQAVYGEARGEPYVGQVAVAAVILNRINSPTFPNTVSGVIFEPRAFTAVADGQIWMDPDETARRAVLDAINGQDPTGSAIYYFNPDTATSGWIWSRPQIKKIGKHIFCK
nr:spore cortex-lytic enzyme [Alkalihalobacillus sp. BA299]